MRRMHTTAMAFVWMAMVGCCTAQQDKLRVVEHRALLALATGAAGEHWVHPWTAAVLATDPCQDEWPGVWCTNDGYVRRIHLHGEHLAGTIPGALGNLKRIEELDLGNNFLTGSIPESLGRLSTLQHLDLSSNNLQGTIPSSLGNLPALGTLNVLSNSFTGGIPDSFRDREDMLIGWGQPREL